MAFIYKCAADTAPTPAAALSADFFFSSNAKFGLQAKNFSREKENFIYFSPFRFLMLVDKATQT